MKTLILSTLLLLSSCSSYVAEMHKGFDKDDNKRRKRPAVHDKFALYRSGKDQKKFTSPNIRDQRRLLPSTRRDYQKEENVRKRYRADDFTHQGNSASLWGNHDNAQHLFTQTTEKKTGEIIIINVNSQLKKDITAELKRAFPDAPPPTKRKGDEAAGDKNGAAAPKAAAKPAPTPDSGEGTKTVHDRISSVVIEKINKNHLLIKGRKTILYKKRRRTVEVQALISKSHISGEDTVESDNILESNVRVVR